MGKRLMTKEEEKRIVEIAEGEIQKFAKEWSDNPYCWYTEADLHAVLSNTIKLALRGINKHLLKAKYKGFKKPEDFSRLSCKPQTYYYDNNRRKSGCFPDIVIYKDIKNPEKPPDYNDKKKINWPMLWVCEIKYKTEWGGDYHEINRQWDKDKLRFLLSQRNNKKINGTDYACCVDFAIGKNREDKGHKREFKADEPCLDSENRFKRYKFIIAFRKPSEMVNNNDK